MSTRRGPGLAVSVTFTFALVAAVGVALNGVVAWRLNDLTLQEEHVKAVRLAAMAASRSLPGPEHAIERLVRDARVHAAVTVDSRGVVVRRAGEVPPLAMRDADVVAALAAGRTSLASEPGGARVPPVIRVVTPLGPPDAPNGALVLWLPARTERGGSAARNIAVIYAILNGSLVAAFGWYLVTRAIVRPLRRLSAATQRVADGELGVRVRAEGSGELAGLAADFNAMTEALAKKLNELEEANASLKAARAEVTQAEKLASLGRLAAGVAHELGNPVAAVTGYVSLLQRHPPPGSEEVLARMEKEMKRVDRIIRDLLEYARPRTPLEQDLDVDRLVEDAVVVLDGQRAFGDAVVTRALGAPGLVRGDPHRLSQVLFNLLLNASDAVRDAAEKRIEVETFRSRFPEAPSSGLRRRSEDPPAPSGDAVCVRVRDTGVGMTEEQQSRLFEPFFTTKAKGTGLGLAISRAIVEGMGGHIRVSGAPGQGAAFEVLLPLAERSVKTDGVSGDALG